MAWHGRAGQGRAGQGRAGQGRRQAPHLHLLRHPEPVHGADGVDHALALRTCSHTNKHEKRGGWRAWTHAVGTHPGRTTLVYLQKTRRVALRGVEVSVVKEVVLVPLVALNAFEPALDRVHRLEHRPHVVVDPPERPQRRARADDGFFFERLESRFAEATPHPQRVEHALADAFHLHGRCEVRGARCEVRGAR